MRNITFIIVALFAANATSAQKAVVPGYQGHRFALEVVGRFAPAIRVPVSNGKNFDNSLSAWHTDFGIMGTYAVKRKQSVQIGFDRGKFGYYTNDGAFSLLNISHNTFHATYLFNQRKGQWAFAPLGNYWGLKLSYSMAKSKYANGNAALSSFGVPNVALQYGVRGSISDRVIYNMGFSFGLLSLLDYFSEIEITTPSRAVRLTTSSRIHVGLGYLL
jgi:hypothetical protein